MKSIVLFLFACLFEVGGGYLIWLWLREDRSFYIGLIGGALLVIYGILATFQPESFGRVYGAYGGVFIVFSILWAYIFDGFKPDRYDFIGAIIILIGVGIMMYYPRN